MNSQKRRKSSKKKKKTIILTIKILDINKLAGLTSDSEIRDLVDSTTIVQGISFYAIQLRASYTLISNEGDVVSIAHIQELYTIN